MNRFIAAFVILGCAACTDRSPIIPQARKAELRGILDEKFTAASIPKEKEEEFYRVLAAFAEGRNPHELVLAVDFTSSREASISFVDGGMHGGGAALAKKKSGRWTVTEKWSSL